jgi:hypothetical protein
MPASSRRKSLRVGGGRADAIAVIELSSSSVNPSGIVSTESLPRRGHGGALIFRRAAAFTTSE